MIPETVLQKLGYARMRLADLEALIANNRLASEPDTRHQLSQELFFHLIGATEYLAQLVNARRSLGLADERVAIHRVVRGLQRRDRSDPLLVPLRSLSADTLKTPMPADPYSPEGLIYRAINYRNMVVHRSTNPFHFVLGAGPKVAFMSLDPRSPSLGHSTRTVDVDLSGMFSLIEQHCRTALAILQ